MDHPKKSAAAAPSLPGDALVEILSLVPAKCLCRFKCVSKSWRDLIADRLRCTTLPQTLAGFFYIYDDGDKPVHTRRRDGCSCDRCSSGIRGRFVDTMGRSVPLASFSFLATQPEIQGITLLSSCNGLVLFGHRVFGDSYDSLGYIVCNPATEQLVAVPSSGCKHESDSESDIESNFKFSYIIFDPAASPHFQLIEFWSPPYEAATVEEVHTYSSETGVWCKRKSTCDEAEAVSFAAGGAFLNGMLHLSATSFVEPRRELIIAVDGEGKNRTVISGLKKHCNVALLLVNAKGVSISWIYVERAPPRCLSCPFGFFKTTTPKIGFSNTV